MRLFAENPQDFINMYNQKFEEFFMDLMKRKFFNQRVNANKVYTDLIGDKEHIHSNLVIHYSLYPFISEFYLMVEFDWVLWEHGSRGQARSRAYRAGLFYLIHRQESWSYIEKTGARAQG